MLIGRSRSKLHLFLLLKILAMTGAINHHANVSMEILTLLLILSMTWHDKNLYRCAYGLVVWTTFSDHGYLYSGERLVMAYTRVRKCFLGIIMQEVRNAEICRGHDWMEPRAQCTKCFYLPDNKTKKSPFWRNFPHWLSWKLFWQIPMQPMINISSK